jgi:UDP-N-acetylglucosamine--N-acetylmuramyl-(pentapeptide) pyrophosphoryl-undecaprenol N-acetylglucosamine transferase
MVMAGGTGGHIFPGLALAEALRERGWRVHWMGGKGTAQKPSMESQLVPARGLPFDAIDFGGLRGKGLLTAALLPMRLLLGFGQSIALLRRIRPDVVIGLGGYITFPGGMMSVLLGKPLVLHEQNSVAGLANRVLAEVADRVYTHRGVAPAGARRQPGRQGAQRGRAAGLGLTGAASAAPGVAPKRRRPS